MGSEVGASPSDRAAVPASVPDAVHIIDQWQCPMSGDVVIHLSDGQSLRLDSRDLEGNKFNAYLAMMGIGLSDGRVDVIQYGRKVGELPSFWQPFLAKSKSLLYDYRPGDLTWKDGAWHACRTLGGGDLDCLVGFVRKDTRDGAPHTGEEGTTRHD